MTSSSRALTDFFRTIQKLRSPQGCPWDKKQTHTSLQPYLIEETYEVIDAIQKKDPILLREELGDLLLQIFLHAQIASDKGQFDIFDVAKDINEKMIRRHPHVFQKQKSEIKTADQVMNQWDVIKDQEKKTLSPKPLLQKIPTAFPGFLEASKIGKAVAKVGFDWSQPKEVFAKIEEELGELSTAVKQKNKKNTEEELGDLLFTIVNLSRKLKVDPELALKKANQKFRKRFSHLESVAQKNKIPLAQLTPDEYEKLWQQAKQKTKQTRHKKI